MECLETVKTKGINENGMSYTYVLCTLKWLREPLDKSFFFFNYKKVMEISLIII